MTEPARTRCVKLAITKHGLATLRDACANGTLGLHIGNAKTRAELVAYFQPRQSAAAPAGVAKHQTPAASAIFAFVRSHSPSAVPLPEKRVQPDIAKNCTWLETLDAAGLVKRRYAEALLDPTSVLTIFTRDDPRSLARTFKSLTNVHAADQLMGANALWDEHIRIAMHTEWAVERCTSGGTLAREREVINEVCDRTGLDDATVRAAVSQDDELVQLEHGGEPHITIKRRMHREMDLANAFQSLFDL
jgi:hypothetical protein